MRGKLPLTHSLSCELFFSDDNFECLLKLADEYQMDKIKKICVEFMASTIDEYGENCLHFCQVADHCGLTENELIQKCIDKAKWLPLSLIQESEYFPQLSSKLIIQLLLEKINVLEKNKEVLDDYYGTCYDLVGTLYHSASKCSERFQRFQCTSDHHPNDLVTTFMFDCEECISKLERRWPTCKPYKAIESLIKKLRSLEADFQNAADPSIDFTPRDHGDSPRDSSPGDL